MNAIQKQFEEFEKHMKFDRKWHLTGTPFQRFDRKKYNIFMAKINAMSEIENKERAEIQRRKDEEAAAAYKAEMNERHAKYLHLEAAKEAAEKATLRTAEKHALLGKKFRKGEIHQLNLNENNSNSNASNNEQMARLHFTNIYKGALCDSEGFYQHLGECWNDAIQMMFLFSDGLKEVVQKKLANAVFLDDIHTSEDTFISNNAINNIIANYNVLYKKLGYTAVPEHIKNELTLYFKTLQHRFIRHYLVEYNRRSLLENESCPVKKPVQRLHVKGRNAILSAIHGKGSTTVFSRQNYMIMADEKGASDEDMLMLIVVYIMTFFNYSEFNLKLLNFFPNTGFIETIKEKNIFNNLCSVLIRSQNHAMCLYTCGGQDFFYDDNYGPFLFPWRSVLTNKTDFTFLGFTTGTLGSGNNTILNIKSSVYPIIISKIGEEENKYYTYYNNKLYSIQKNVLTLVDKDDSLSPNSKETYIKYENDKYLIKIYIPIVYTPTSAIQIENASFQFNRGMRLQRTGPVLGGKRKNKNKQTRRQRTRHRMTRKN